jgi:ribosome-binding factor A
MPTQNFHVERLAEMLQREIGTIIAQEMRDPRIPPVVTVTRVKLAQDIRNATVFVSIYGDEDVKSNAVEALNKAVSFIQRVAASRIVVKHFPRLHFKIDNSIEHGRHIDELLKDIQNDLE